MELDQEILTDVPGSPGADSAIIYIRIHQNLCSLPGPFASTRDAKHHGANSHGTVFSPELGSGQRVESKYVLFASCLPSWRLWRTRFPELRAPFLELSTLFQEFFKPRSDR